MGEYKNIDRVETIDDGTMSVFMKNGRQAIIEIVKLNEKFEAAIYGKIAAETAGIKAEKKDSLLKRLKQCDVYKECAQEAIGWVDENHLDFVEREEIKNIK